MLSNYVDAEKQDVQAFQKGIFEIPSPMRSCTAITFLRSYRLLGIIVTCFYQMHGYNLNLILLRINAKLGTPRFNTILLNKI